MVVVPNERRIVVPNESKIVVPNEGKANLQYTNFHLSPTLTLVKET